MRYFIHLFFVCFGICSFCIAKESTSLIDNSSILSTLNQSNFYSQAGQDRFVYGLLYGILGKKDKGYYLEIGADDPVIINNTYFFEKNCQWKGVSIDISNEHEKKWPTVRKNPLLIEDALKSDYVSILKSFPHNIDYLSLDIDSCYDLVLERIPLKDYIFKVITIEHDAYKYGNLYKDREREILKSYGYLLICSDVKNSDCVFEDWWIHPSVFPSSVISQLISLNLQAKDYSQNIEGIFTLIKRGS